MPIINLHTPCTDACDICWYSRHQTCVHRGRVRPHDNAHACYAPFNTPWINYFISRYMLYRLVLFLEKTASTSVWLVAGPAVFSAACCIFLLGMLWLIGPSWVRLNSMSIAYSDRCYGCICLATISKCSCACKSSAMTYTKGFTTLILLTTCTLCNKYFHCRVL